MSTANASVKSSKPTKKKAKKLEPPSKQKISKFGQMHGVYKGLIIEHADTWD